MSKILMKSPSNRRYLMVELGLHVLQSEKNGGCVLKSEKSWRKISGFMLNTTKGCWWFYFRRSQNYK